MSHTHADHITTDFLPPAYKSLLQLQKIILDSLDFDEVVNNVVNALLFDIGFLKSGYKIIVLTLFDEEKQCLKRVALSQTQEAQKALEASAVPFSDIEIPLSAHNNLLVKAFTTNTFQITQSWPDIFTPALTIDEANANQLASGIKTSMIYPVFVKEKPIGVLIFSMVKEPKEVTDEEKELIRGFTDVVGLAVQNSTIYTKLQATSKKLKHANLRLKELDVLKNEFVSVASHELRTPMTAIKSYLWLALNQSATPLDSDTHESIQIAYNSTERLIHLVQNMLTISRIEGNRFEIHKADMNLTEVLTDAMRELQISADEKKITLSFQNPYGDVIVNGDKEKLREVAQNIIGNALKFTPDEGSITITYERVEPGHIIATHIHDTGPGIPKEDLPKLFHKFSRLEHSYQKIRGTGTGLGLYIAKQILTMHNGEITVESVVGQGSTFTFSLPEALTTQDT